MWIPDPRFEMPELLIPGKKPAGSVVIDWSNQITRSMELFATCGEVKTSIRNKVTGEQLTEMTAGANSVVATGNGIGIESAASLNGGYTTAADIPGTSGSYSLMFQCKFPVPHVSWTTFFRANTLTRHHVLLDANGLIGCYDNNGAGFYSSGYDTDNLSGVHTVVATVNGSNTTFFISGKNVGTASRSMNAEVRFLLNATSGQGIKSPVLCIAAFSRELADSEAISLSNNPYQLVVPA